MPLNGVMALILRYFNEFGRFRAHRVKARQDMPKLSASEYSPMHLVFNDISLTMSDVGNHSVREVKRKRGSQI